MRLTITFAIAFTTSVRRNRTRPAAIKAVVIPHGRSGVIGGAMLGLGRAMGETVAVFTVLNIVFQVNWHVLLGAGGNVASLIILKFGDASPYEIKALIMAQRVAPSAYAA